MHRTGHASKCWQPKTIVLGCACCLMCTWVPTLCTNHCHRHAAATGTGSKLTCMLAEQLATEQHRASAADTGTLLLQAREAQYTPGTCACSAACTGPRTKAHYAAPPWPVPPTADSLLRAPTLESSTCTPLLQGAQLQVSRPVFGSRGKRAVQLVSVAA